MSATAYNKADLIIPNSARYKAGVLQAWRPDVNLLEDITFSQNTANASRVNQSGEIEFVAANIPRWEWPIGGGCPKLLIEPQVTNLFDQDLATGAPATQTITVVSGEEYSVTMRGTGSITLSGADTSTVTQASSATFTAATTSLVCTLSGSVDYVNVNLGKPTSIIYTSGSTGTRNKDLYSVDLSAITTDEYTVFFDIEADGARLLMEAGTTGFDLDFTNSGKFAMLVGATTITFQFPDNGQPQTSVTFEKPADFRNISFEAKLGTVKLATAGWIASVLLPADYNQWLSGTVSSGYLIDWEAVGLTAVNYNSKDLDYFPFPEIYSATQLTALSLQNNQLTGTIPTELGNLTNLTQLYLFTNQLTGTIPTELGNLTNLTQLGLHANQLTGSIPTELGSLTNLGLLYLHANQLTGSIPTELGSLTNLTLLYLYSNQLTGSNITTISATCTNIQIHNNDITSATDINNLLIAADTAGASNGNFKSEGGTNAAPTGAGITAKSNLIGKGWTVTTN